MTGLEIVTVISGVLNVLGAIAGLLGWKSHRRVRDRLERVQRAGEAIIQGVEACEKLLHRNEVRQVKRSIQKVAEAAGAEGFLHRWLVRLGLADDDPSHDAEE